MNRREKLEKIEALHLLANDLRVLAYQAQMKAHALEREIETGPVSDREEVAPMSIAGSSHYDARGARLAAASQLFAGNQHRAREVRS